MQLTLEQIKPLEFTELDAFDNCTSKTIIDKYDVYFNGVNWIAEHIAIQYKRSYIGEYKTLLEAKRACNFYKLSLINQELL
jgi:hypothetical protein